MRKYDEDFGPKFLCLLYFAFPLQHALAVILLDEKNLIVFFPFAGYFVAVDGASNFPDNVLSPSACSMSLAPFSFYRGCFPYHRINITLPFI